MLAGCGVTATVEGDAAAPASTTRHPTTTVAPPTATTTITPATTLWPRPTVTTTTGPEPAPPGGRADASCTNDFSHINWGGDPQTVVNAYGAFPL